MLLHCPHSPLSTFILQHSISFHHRPATSSAGQTGRLNRAREWQTDVRKHALTAFQNKHNVSHLCFGAVNADLSRWNLNGVFGCIILCCIISNYGPYATLLWQLRGHSHLYEHVIGILMDRSHDRPALKFSAVGVQACQMKSLAFFDGQKRRTSYLTWGYFKANFMKNKRA